MEELLLPLLKGSYPCLLLQSRSLRPASVRALSEVSLHFRPFMLNKTTLRCFSNVQAEKPKRSRIFTLEFFAFESLSQRTREGVPRGGEEGGFRVAARKKEREAVGDAAAFAAGSRAKVMHLPPRSA